MVSTVTPRLVKLYGVRLLFKHPLQLCMFATVSFRVDFEKNERFDTKFLFLQFAADNMNSVSKFKKKYNLCSAVVYKIIISTNFYSYCLFPQSSGTFLGKVYFQTNNITLFFSVFYILLSYWRNYAVFVDLLRIVLSPLVLASVVGSNILLKISFLKWTRCFIRDLVSIMSLPLNLFYCW